MRLRHVLPLIVFAAACFGQSQKRADPVDFSLNAADWTLTICDVNTDPPTCGPSGAIAPLSNGPYGELIFTFPDKSTGYTVNTLQWRFTSTMHKFGALVIYMATVNIEGAPVFNVLPGPCDHPAYARGYFARQGDTGRNLNYQWWSVDAYSYSLEDFSDNKELSIAFYSGDWQNAKGEDPSAQFDISVGHPEAVGLALGCNMNGGVNTSDGTAQFIIKKAELK